MPQRVPSDSYHDGVEVGPVRRPRILPAAAAARRVIVENEAVLLLTHTLAKHDAEALQAWLLDSAGAFHESSLQARLLHAGVGVLALGVSDAGHGEAVLQEAQHMGLKLHTAVATARSEREAGKANVSAPRPLAISRAGIRGVLLAAQDGVTSATPGHAAYATATPVQRTMHALLARAFTPAQVLACHVSRLQRVVVCAPAPPANAARPSPPDKNEEPPAGELASLIQCHLQDKEGANLLNALRSLPGVTAVTLSAKHTPHMSRRLMRRLWETPRRGCLPFLNTARGYFGDALGFYLAWAALMCQWLLLPAAVSLAGHVAHALNWSAPGWDTAFLALAVPAWGLLVIRSWQQLSSHLSFKWAAGTSAVGTELDKQAGDGRDVHAEEVGTEVLLSRQHSRLWMCFGLPRNCIRYAVTSCITACVAVAVLSLLAAFMFAAGELTPESHAVQTQEAAPSLLASVLATVGLVPEHELAPDNACRQGWATRMLSVAAAPLRALDDDISLAHLDAWVAQTSKAALSIPFYEVVLEVVRAVFVLAINSLLLRPLARLLTGWEDDTAQAARVSLAGKRFFLEATDVYFKLFMLAFIVQDSSLLQHNVLIMLSADAAWRLVTDAVVPAALAWRRGARPGAAEHTLDMYEGTFEDCLTLILQFGYVAMFAVGVSSLSFPLALLATVLELLADVYRYTQVLQRPLPQACEGLGVWEGVLIAQAWLAVSSNVLLLATTGDLANLVRPVLTALCLQQDNDALSVTQFVWALEHIVLLLCLILWHAVPAQDPGVVSAQQHYWTAVHRKRAAPSVEATRRRLELFDNWKHSMAKPVLEVPDGVISESDLRETVEHLMRCDSNASPAASTPSKLTPRTSPSLQPTPAPPSATVQPLGIRRSVSDLRAAFNKSPS